MKSASICLVTCALAALPLQAQDIRQIVDGNGPTAGYPIADFPKDMKAVRISIAGDMNPWMYFNNVAVLNLGRDAQRQAAKEAIAFVDCASAFWTKGEKAAIEGLQFLIVYKLDIPPAELQNAQSLRSWLKVRAPKLALQLVRIDTIARIEPLPHLSVDIMTDATEAIFSILKAPEEGEDAVAGEAFLPGTQEALQYTASVLAAAIIEYTRHNGNLFPKAATAQLLRAAVRPYLTPETVKYWDTRNPNKSQFVYNTTLGGLNRSELVQPWKVPMLYESVAWPNGKRAVVFADRQCKLLDAKEWKAAQAFLKATTAEK